jgi:hypothetical protein
VKFNNNLNVVLLFFSMFRQERRQATSLPRMMAAGLESRFRQMLRASSPDPSPVQRDTVSIVCRTRSFLDGIFSNTPTLDSSTRSRWDSLNCQPREPEEQPLPDPAPMEETATRVFLGMGYQQCLADRRALSSVLVHTFDTNSINGTTISNKHFFGTFESPHNTDTANTFLATRHNTQHNLKQNISLSFDPKTLMCTTCEHSHSIMNTYHSGHTQPLTIVITDQSFNASLSGSDTGSLCIKIVRSEDGAMRELVDLLFEIFGKGGVPAGTVFLLGSATELANKGSSGYAWEFVKQKIRIERRWPATRVCIVPPVLLCGAPVCLHRYMVEIRGWIATTYGSDPAGLIPVWNAAIDSNNVMIKKEQGAGYYTLQFPANLTANPDPTYLHYENCTLSPDNLTPIVRKANIDIIRALYGELNKGFSGGLGPGVSLERTEDGQGDGAKDKPDFIVIGASHMERVASFLTARGNIVQDFAEKSWVVSDGAVEKLKTSLKNAKIGPGSVVVIDPLSNSATKYKQADDSLALAQKIEGGWHLPGEIAMIEDEQIRVTLSKLKPALEKFAGCKMIFIPPIPRYFFGGCCEKTGHCSNAREENHSTHMLQEHFRIRNTMKTHIIANTPQATRKDTRILDLITNTVSHDSKTPHQQLKSLREITAHDNVHLRPEGYRRLASAVEKEAATLMADTAVKQATVGGGQPTSYWKGFVVHHGIGKIGAARWPEIRSNSAAGHVQSSHNNYGAPGQWRGAGRGGRGGRGRGSRQHPYSRKF